MRVRAPHLAAAALTAVAAIGLSACGSSSDGSAAAPAATTTAETATTPAPSSGAGSSLTLTADPGGALKFDTTTLSAKAGTVTITLDNPSSVPHAIAVEGDGVDQDGETVQEGGTSTVTVTLKAGTYTFYCPVPGHEAAGMKGTLTVS